jgi:hypothetical protein
MVLYTETGEFVAPYQEKDKGTFTVQTSDVPLALRRSKTRKLGHNTQYFRSKKVRLTPINEKEETDEREEVVVESESCATISPVSITMTSPDGECTYITNERSFHRSDTPAVHRKSVDTALFLDLDTFEEELENIPEHENKVRDPDVLGILSTLPPRPKCKRKVLPPSITTGVDNLKPKKKKLLKLRSRQENILGHSNFTISKDLQNVMKRQTLQVLNEQRPKSAEHGVRVLTLSDLSSTNSSSVPDLPSIMSKIAKSNESHIRNETNEHGNMYRSKTTMYEDSGALSTPRDDNSGANPTATPEKCLKGSDIASFYNMWDRDRKTRPFDKKGSDKLKINLRRDCLCSIRNCARKCFNQRNQVLPPIASPSRDI